MIPDKNDVTRNNAIFYSSAGTFSFNTAKFKNFHYFKAMKDKIASNWHPPLLANINIGGYAPGMIRVRAIPSQEVKIYFSMNRDGEVVDVKVLDSFRNKQKTASYKTRGNKRCPRNHGASGLETLQETHD